MTCHVPELIDAAELNTGEPVAVPPLYTRTVTAEASPDALLAVPARATADCVTACPAVGGVPPQLAAVVSIENVRVPERPLLPAASS